MTTNSPALILHPPPVASSNTVAASEELRDIKPPVKIPDAWFWFWSVAGLLTLLALSYWAWRRWQKKRLQKGAVPERIIPAHERARQRLREALALLDQPRPFCILVSDTIRIYLEERFD